MSFKVMAVCAGRHGGNGEALAKEALCAVREAGGEVELINLFDYNILPCTGCEGCTMQMGKMGAGLQKEYHGCVLKNKDDVDAIIRELQTCQGVIFSVPTYDLTPSSVYTRFAQRFLAYELSFLLAIGAVKENPYTVAGLISVGGSMHDWQSLALESLQATMFTMSMTVVDRYMAQRDGRPGNAFVWGDDVEWGGQIARAHKMGENIVKAIRTPVGECCWLGDPDDGVPQLPQLPGVPRRQALGWGRVPLGVCGLRCRWRHRNRRAHRSPQAQDCRERPDSRPQR